MSGGIRPLLLFAFENLAISIYDNSLVLSRNTV